MISLKRIVLCFNVSAGIFIIAIPRMGDVQIHDILRFSLRAGLRCTEKSCLCQPSALVEWFCRSALLMKKTQSTRPIWSQAKIVLVSAGAAVAVLAASLLTQWLIYDDWLHRTGPLRIVGTCIATAVTFLFALRWQLAIRERQLEMVRRMEMILQMNDRIRNALQAIECLTYVAQAEATDSVRKSVDVIDSVLRQVLAESGHPHEANKSTAVRAAVPDIQSKSA